MIWYDHKIRCYVSERNQVPKLPRVPANNKPETDSTRHENIANLQFGFVNEKRCGNRKW